jgi:hypothetical protein
MSAPLRFRTPDARARAGVGLALFATIACTAPAAACPVSIAESPGEVLLPYDPFAIPAPVADMAFRVRNPGETACTFDVAILDPSRFPIETFEATDAGLLIELRANGNGAAMTKTSQPGVWRATLAAGETKHFRFDGVVTRDGVPLAGRQGLPLRLELREPGSTLPLEVAQEFALVIQSPPRAQMNIAGASAAFGEGGTLTAVDLGELATGLTRRVFLQVRSNVTQSRLTITSEHKGELKPTGGDTPPDLPGVPYHLELQDERIDLSSRQERTLAAPRSMAGAALPLDIVIDDAGGRAAGTYSDTITLELSPL